MVSNINDINLTKGVNSVKPTETAPKALSEPQKPPAKNMDEYIPSEDKEPIGLYAVEADEDGKLSVNFDDPETKSETTTANTDAVDSEIKQLKEKQRLLQRQLRGADGAAAAELQRQLEQISQELAIKDNDTYRRANTLFT